MLTEVDSGAKTWTRVRNTNRGRVYCSSAASHVLTEVDSGFSGAKTWTRAGYATLTAAGSTVPAKTWTRVRNYATPTAAGSTVPANMDHGTQLACIAADSIVLVQLMLESIDGQH